MTVRKTHSVLIACVVLGLFAWPGLASATPRFPRDMSDATGASTQEPCSVCHAGGVTATGTVTTLFGQALRVRGLAADDSDSLRNALESLHVEGVDSDYDGVSDYDEIAMGTDPNLAAGQTPAPPVNFGCSIQSSSRSAGVCTLLFGVALFTFAIRRRFRNR